MKQQNRSFAILISFVILAIGAVLAYARYRVADNVGAVAIGVGAVVLALIVSATLQVADQRDRAVKWRQDGRTQETTNTGNTSGPGNSQRHPSIAVGAMNMEVRASQ
jgi:membrane protein YdbS with pleckstrin-like domain